MRAPEMTSSWCLYREHISHLVLVFLLLTLNMQLPAGMWKLTVIYFQDNFTCWSYQKDKVWSLVL